MIGRKNILILLVLILSASVIKAQQLPLTGLYYDNHYLLNPASAGEHGHLVGLLNHRRQWVGLEGAPVTNLLSLNTPLRNKNSAVGFNITSDKANIFQRLSGNITYSQRFNFSKKIDHYIAFGASIGFVNNSINLDDAIVEDASDLLLQQGNDAFNGTSLNVDAGMRYVVKGFEFGAAAPQVLESIVQNQLEDEDFVELKRHFIGYMRYKFNIADKWFITPGGLVRMLESGLYQYDGNLNVSYKDVIWIGGTYRSEGGIIPSLGIKVADQFTLAYAYTIDNAGIATRGSGTHEIMIGFHLPPRKDLAEKKDIEEVKWTIDSLELQHDDLRFEVDSLELELQKLEEKNLEQDVNILNNWDYLNDVEQRVEGLEELRKEMNVEPASEVPSKPNSPAEKSDTSRVEDELMQIQKTISPEGKEEIIEVELASGYYVVIESFRSMENAERYVNAFNERGSKAIIVHNRKRGWFYVYLRKYDDLQSALGAMRVTRINGFKDAWVHIYKK